MSFFLNNGYLVTFIERRLGREMFFLWCRFKILNFVHDFDDFGIFRLFTVEESWNLIEFGRKTLTKS